MYRGMTIEELINSVERAEQHAQQPQEQQALAAEVRQASYYHAPLQAYPEVA